MDPNINNIRFNTETTWKEVEGYLRTKIDSFTDDELDELSQKVFSEPQNPHIVPLLIIAFEHAQSSLTQRSIAFALAYSASSDDVDAIDTLTHAYRQYKEDIFLGSSILEALGLLAQHSQIAFSDITSILLRLNEQTSRYLLIKAAKIIGRLHNINKNEPLRNKLEEFTLIPDLAVQAEAYYQYGLILLSDAFLSSDTDELKQQLNQARLTFREADFREENRDDARLFNILIDIVLSLSPLIDTPVSIDDETIHHIKYLRSELQKIHFSIYKDYRSHYSNIIALRILEIVDILTDVINSAHSADDWTNFDAVLIEFATLHTLIKGQSISEQNNSHIDLALSSLADQILLPILGPVIKRAIGRRRLIKVIENYQANPNHDVNIIVFLQALEQILLSLEAEPIIDIQQNIGSTLEKLAKQLNLSPDEIFKNFLEAVDNNGVDRFIKNMGLQSARLPIDHPNLYGSDPTIDDTARKLFSKLKHQLEDYPPLKWNRLQEIIIHILSFVHYIRDEMPEYTRCVEDGGIGQKANEGDLQKHLFENLRSRFNRNVLYELSRIGGGRSDNGLRFDECFFPIEVKHVFDSINPQHIHDHFLTQADIYASATDRVSFLLILDLRDSNAAGHIKTVRQKRKREQREQVANHTSLYTLEDSFWVDALSPDPQLPHMKSNAVIIGLVPGNRPRPSRTTKYSQRPRPKSNPTNNT